MEIKETRTCATEEVVALVCDLCGTRSPGPDWSHGFYDVDKVNINWSNGKCYPGDVDTDFTWVDLCPTCFRTRLLTWVVAQGGQYQIEDRPWGTKTISLASVTAEFQALAAQWRADSQYDSAAFHMTAAYQQIIDLDWPVVPVLLGELERRPDWWFMALTAITGEQPVRPEHAGNLTAMTEDWLAWGRQRGVVPAP